MENLRFRTIRLAYENPSLRPYLLPMLSRVAKDFATQDSLEKYLKEHPKADPKRHQVVESEKTDPEPESRGTGKSYFSKKEIDKLPDAGEVNQPGGNNKEALKKQADEAHEQQLDWLNRGKGIDKAIGAQVIRGDQGAVPIKDKVEQTSDGKWSTKDADGKPKTFDSEEDAEYFAEGVGNEKRAEYFSDLPEGPVVLIGPKKSLTGRAQEKVDAKYDGDWSKLKDFVRASVIVDKVDQLDDLMGKLKKSGLKLAAKPDDRFSKPTEAGYRDLSLNVVYPNGHVGELQVHLKPMIQAKEGFGGHKLYEKSRKFSAQAKKEGRSNLNSEEQKIVDDLNDQQKQLYGAAWREIQGEKGALRKHVESGRGKSGSDKTAADRPNIQYFQYDEGPAYWQRGKFPISVTSKGEVVEYNLKKFSTQATEITKAEYEKLKKSSRKASLGDRRTTLRSNLIRLAHANPALRPDLLPLLKSGSTDYIRQGDNVEILTRKGWVPATVVSSRYKRTGGYEVSLTSSLGDLKFNSKTGMYDPKLIRFVGKADAQSLQKEREGLIERREELEEKKEGIADEGRKALDKFDPKPGDKVQIRYSNGQRIWEIVNGVNQNTGKVGIVKAKRRSKEEENQLLHAFWLLNAASGRNVRPPLERDTRWIFAQNIVAIEKMTKDPTAT